MPGLSKRRGVTIKLTEIDVAPKQRVADTRLLVSASGLEAWSRDCTVSSRRTTSFLIVGTRARSGLQQLVGRALKSVCDPLETVDGDVCLCALHLTDEGAVEAGLVSKRFLREAALQPTLPDVGGDLAPKRTSAFSHARLICRSRVYVDSLYLAIEMEGLGPPWQRSLNSLSPRPQSPRLLANPYSWPGAPFRRRSTPRTLCWPPTPA